MRRLRAAAVAVLAAGALACAGNAGAFADVIKGDPFSGRKHIDQDGKQNLDCGNSARLIRINLFRTVHREKVCVDTDGHTHRRSHHHGGAEAQGDTTIGPQFNTAQSGKQNLFCGNSADVITVNIAGTINQDTTCAALARGRHHGRDGHHGRDHHPRDARALGGTAIGGQVNTAQTGKQNLYCGNFFDTATINVLGTVRKHVTCLAADRPHGHGSGIVHRGHALADAGQVAGSVTNTAQNGRQNQTCGQSGIGLDLPLGEVKRDTRCSVHDGSHAGRR
ncbi:hypothetical protein ACFVT2_35880 [Streptomyces sp. NPDC058000]|uniref:hypothetical protein n=1 Tax=Streptomyces sp. NPDC058000 TaxID=3346299 RepID=UPI0036F188E6